MKKQTIFISILAVVITGTALFAVPRVYAETSGNTGTHMNFFQELIAFISQKFGLDKTQVQSAVTDFSKQKKATMTPRPTQTPQQIADQEKTRLDALVKDGKISADQETAIINELAVLRAKYNQDNWKNLTTEERRTQMTAMRDEIISWAKSQGIDSSYVIPGVGIGRGFGMEGKGMMGGRGRGIEGKWDKEVSPVPVQ
jgi:hypothetical protein